MDVTSAYLTSTKNFPGFMAAVQKAAVPTRFTHEFLQVLGFKSTSDRAFIPMLKGLGLIDQGNVPTQAYRDYRNSAIAKQVLARQVKLAYPGLFNADVHAEVMTDENLRGRLSTITGKDVSVVQKMATTFKALCALADFSAPVPEAVGETKAPGEIPVESPALNLGKPPPQTLQFSHTIYINLPATSDVTVYDAIFKRIRENLNLTESVGFRELQRRAFQSLMLSSRIQSMESEGDLVTQVDVPIATELLGRFEDFVPNAIAIRLAVVAHAFALLYSFENMARDLVRERLDETKGSDWWNVLAVVPNSVKARVRGLREKADENKWHDVEAKSDMDYTLFSDLIAIVDTNWPDFKDFFPDQLWVKTRLGELEMSRNAIMHGRMLPPSEIARIEQYFDDWIDQVG